MIEESHRNFVLVSYPVGVESGHEFEGYIMNSRRTNLRIEELELGIDPILSSSLIRLLCSFPEPASGR